MKTLADSIAETEHRERMARLCQKTADDYRYTSAPDAGENFDSITLLNTSILTEYGQYKYSPISLNEAQTLTRSANTALSAIGHQATAEIMTELLGMPISVNRINYSQRVGERAIVFKLRGRPPEGAILSREEIDLIGYDFGMLERLA